METVHWIALVLAVAGLAMVFVGVQQQRGARHSDELVGGFGGPPGSSDVGTADGFGGQAPTVHYPVGRTWRLAGMGLVLVALVLVISASLT